MSTDNTRSFQTAGSIWTRLPNETSSNQSPTPSSPSSHSSPRPTQSSTLNSNNSNQSTQQFTSNLNTGGSAEVFPSNTSTSTSTSTSGDLIPPSASERLQSLRTRLSPSPSRGVPSIAFEPSSFSPSPPNPSSPRGPPSSFSPRPPGSNRSVSFGAYDTTNYRTSFTQALSANSSPFSPPLSSSALTTPSTNHPHHLPSQSATTNSSTQPLLAEIFSGRPRPHFRSSTSYSSHAHSHSTSETTNSLLPPSPSSSSTIFNDLTTATSTTAPSYFAAPTGGRPSINRARSQSSAPTFDSFNNNNNNNNNFSSNPSNSNLPIGGGGNMSYGAPGSGLSQSFAGADQHGWRPSTTTNHQLTSNHNYFSASLPTTSAVGSPTFSSFINLNSNGGGGGGRDQSHSPSRGGGSSSTYSPFARPNSSLSGGGGVAKPGAFLSQSFSTTTGWEEFEREREGRARVRDTWATSSSSVGGGSGSLNTTPGTGLSPFSRDSSRLTEETNTSDLPSIGGDSTTWGSLGPGGVYKVRRDYSLGAVGSGRKRSDSAWGGTRERILREQDEDDDAVAPPTKSGATSRRHSFAAFEVPFRSSNQTIGFHLPQEVTKEVVGSSNSSGFGSISNGLRMGMGSSAIDDDDLAADLNSLHLSLDAHAKEQQERATSTSAGTTTSTLHVGSMPVDFPPARSRRFDSSRSPETKPSTLLSSTSPQPPVSLIPGSPRATAEPFTPSATALVAPPPPPTQTQTRSNSNSLNPSTSVASRFFSAPSPLPPTTTNAVATATPGGGPSSRFDFFGMPSPIPQQAQQQQQQQRFGLPPPPLNHQQGFYAPQNRGPPPPPPPPGSNFRGPPPPPTGSTFSPFAPSPYQSPSLQHPPPPPPHLMNIVPPLAHLNQQPNYFSAAPPPPPPSSSQNQNSSSSSNNNNNNAPAMTSQSQSDMSLGRGVPLHSIPPESPLCIIGFKAGRKDLFFCEDPNLVLEEGDLVIVEADRGRDVGKYLKKCSIEEVHKFQQHMVELALGQLANPASMTAMGFGPGNQINNQSGGGPGGNSGGAGAGAGPAQLARMTKECQPKRIYAKAGPADTHALLAKAQDELKALQLVRGKVAQKGLPMEILDAEWQWDRRKLTFYYTADQRVDFRELVRELFRIWKTRVWLCCLDQQGPSLDFV